MFTKKKKRKLSIKEFQQMQAYRKAVETEKEKQEIKFVLMEEAKKSYGDKWYRLKDGTKKAIDRLCWFAAEKGYVFESDKSLAANYGVSVSTIRNVIKHLEKHGIIYKVYRFSSRQNGLGNPVKLFTGHKYFSYWNTLLDLNYQAEYIAGCKAENEETLTATRDIGAKKVSTDDLPIITKKDLLNKRNKGRLDHSYVSDRVPKEFKETVGQFFDDAKTIEEYWKMVTITRKTYINQLPDSTESEIIETAIHAFKQMVRKYKNNSIKNNPIAYFTGVFNKKLEKLSRQAKYYNWLEEGTQPIISGF